MKELKVVLLVLAIGFGSTVVPATPKFPNTFYPNTIKGGLQTSEKHQSKVAALGVEGDYEYYLQYVRYKLDYKKNEEHDGKKALLSPSCVLADTVKASC